MCCSCCCAGSLSQKNKVLLRSMKKNTALQGRLNTGQATGPGRPAELLCVEHLLHFPRGQLVVPAQKPVLDMQRAVLTHQVSVSALLSLVLCPARHELGLPALLVLSISYNNHPCCEISVHSVQPPHGWLQLPCHRTLTTTTL